MTELHVIMEQLFLKSNPFPWRDGNIRHRKINGCSRLLVCHSKVSHAALKSHPHIRQKEFLGPFNLFTLEPTFSILSITQQFFPATPTEERWLFGDFMLLLWSAPHIPIVLWFSPADETFLMKSFEGINFFLISSPKFSRCLSRSFRSWWCITSHILSKFFTFQWLR